MKTLLSLLALIVIAGGAYRLGPHMESIRIPESTRIESIKPVEMVKDTAPKQKPVETPEKAPQKELPKKVVEPEPVAVAQSPSAGKVNNIVPCETFRPLLAKYSWNVDVAVKVIDAESYGGLDGMCNTLAKNPEAHYIRGVVYCYGSYGLFQISCHGGQIYDVEQNIAVAWSKYKAGGWSPWGVCNRRIVSCY